MYKWYKRLVYTHPDLLARFCKVTLASRAWSDRGRPGSKPGPKASVSPAIGRAGQAINSPIP